MIRNVCSIKQYWFKACRRRCCNRIKSAWTQEFKQNFRNSQSYVCRSKDKNIFYRIKNPQTTHLRDLQILIMVRQMGLECTFFAYYRFIFIQRCMPDIFKESLEKEEFWKHLTDVQKTMDAYMDNYCNIVTHSEEYCMWSAAAHI